MLKKNKWTIILSSLVVLLPIVYGLIMWDQLPQTLATHWGADGVADGFSSKAFAVFGLPAILLVLHLLCLVGTLLDKKQQAQNAKAMRMVFWIVPAISLGTNALVYRTAFGQTFHMTVVMPALMGLLFLITGNYLPKISQNHTLGIKISWTLRNEENWNKTHRLAGKLWVVGGLVSLATIFLPAKAMLWMMALVPVTMMVIPVAYSYSIYRRHQKQGISYERAGKGEKIAVRIGAVVGSLILVGCLALMVTGNVRAECGDTALQISATYWEDAQVDYDDIDTLEFRDTLDVGVRSYGFGSFRLSLGGYENEEFGVYTLYAYNGADGYVVLTSGERTLVIALETKEATYQLYETILGK